jgi:hypothetical protein
MNERKLIDEIKRLVNDDVIIGYYNGTTFTDDNGRTYSNLVTNNSPIGRGFIVPYNNQWLVVVANNNQEVRKNIITSRRKISIEDKTKPIIDYLLIETPKIRFIFDTSGSLDSFYKDEFNKILANIKETLTEIHGANYVDNINTYVTNSVESNERWLNWMIPTSEDEIVIAVINESNPIYHNTYSDLESATFNADRNDFETAYNLNPDRKFKGFIYAIEPLERFNNHITFVFEKYNLSSYNLSYKFVDSYIDAATVEQDFLEFITSNTFYTIRDNKWKKYELPETVVLKNLNYYIDSNYVVIKSDVKEEGEDKRFNQLTVLKDDVFTTYTYPEELPVLKTWRKDIYNTYNVITFESSGVNVYSTINNSIGTGSKTFIYTASSNLGWLIGSRLRAAYDKNNYMEGVITVVSNTSVTISVDNTVGSGTYTSWNITTRTSTTSNSIGTGSKTFTYYIPSSNLGWLVNTRLRAANDVSNYIEGVVTAVNSTSVTITSDNAVGSGTYISWNITINNNKYSNKLVTMQQNRLYKLITNLNDIIEALSLKKSINLDISKCRFTEDSITSCRKESKLKSPKLDTDIISSEEIKRQTIVSTYIKYQ